jgi:hypothetical protein
MTRQWFRWAIVFGAMLLMSAGATRQAAADPIVIASLMVQSGVDHTGPADGSGRFRFDVTPRSDLPVAPLELFANRLITTADVGATIVADASTDADFAAFTQQLTNGEGNRIEELFVFEGVGGSGLFDASEAGLFGFTDHGPDFIGFSLAGFALHVDALTAGPSPDLPGFERLTFRGRLNVLANAPAGSPTPEPATLSLLAIGVVGMVGARRRRRAD